MPTGTVKWYSAEKGYGFIRPDDGAGDIFLHIREVEAAGIDILREGQKISYEPVSDRKTGRIKAGRLQPQD